MVYQILTEFACTTWNNLAGGGGCGRCCCLLPAGTTDLGLRLRLAPQQHLVQERRAFSFHFFMMVMGSMLYGWDRAARRIFRGPVHRGGSRRARSPGYWSMLCAESLRFLSSVELFRRVAKRWPLWTPPLVKVKPCRGVNKIKTSR
jgi:hypothetical protein